MALIKLFMVFVVVSLPIAAGLSAITRHIQQAIKNKEVKKNEWRNVLEIINF